MDDGCFCSITWILRQAVQVAGNAVLVPVTVVTGCIRMNYQVLQIISASLLVAKTRLE